MFLIILVLGWFAARLLRAGVSRLLRRVGFDQAVERGGVGRVLGRTRYDARGLVTTLVYYAVLLFALQLAFGIWGPNPVSDLIAGIVAWLPRAFVAIVIVVVAAAIAAGVRNVIIGALRGLSYARPLAGVAGAFILGIGIVAALDQIGVATSVTTPVLVAILATVGGILVVGVGGGLVRPMQSRWESWLSRAEQEMPQVREQFRVAAERREAEAREEAARREAEARAAAEREEAARREQEAREAAEAEARAAEAEARAAEAEARAAELAREQEAERAREAELAREQEAGRAREAELAREQEARDEAASIEAEREEAARQDAARAEAARQDATLREVAQVEAVQEEVAQAEAAREEVAQAEAAREEVAQAEAAREEAARQEAKPAKTRTSRPRTARDRAEQAAEHRAAADAGTLPQASPSDEPTVAIPISTIQGASTGSGQDAEQTQPITLPVAGAADDPERTQVLPTSEPKQPAQPVPPSTPRRRRPQGGGTSK